MLFAALLLIKWVTLTIGATAPLFPRKEIHLKIPVASRSSTETSGINPPIFRDLKDWTEIKFRHLAKIPFVQKDLEKTRSPLNPLADDVKAKSRSKREALSTPPSSQSPHSGNHIPTPANMNNPSLDNEKDVAKMSHLLLPRGLGDLFSGNGEDDALSKSDHNDHYSKPLQEDSTTNSTTFIPKISFSYGEHQNMKKKDILQDSNNTVKFNEIQNEGILNSNKTFTHSPNGDYMSSTSTPTVTSSRGISVESVIETSENITVSDSTKERGRKPLQDNQGRSNITSTQMRGTRKPKSRMRNNRKHKVLVNSPKLDVIISNNETTDATSYNPMLQDGAYQTVTSTTTLFLDNTRLHPETDKVQNDSNLNEKVEKFMKINYTILLSVLSSTTPDSHMNDPPFRGPNIPQEVDNFYNEKGSTKNEYSSPDKIEKAFSVDSIMRFFYRSSKDESWILENSFPKIAWDCHIYVIGTLFAIIAVYSFISLLRVHTFITLLQTSYYIAVNGIILYVCLSRTFYLFYPSILSEKFPKVLASILLKFTYPCITTSIFLLSLSLWKSTETIVYPSCVQKPFVFTFIILLIFSLALSVEIAVWIFHASRSFLILELAVFLIYAQSIGIFYYTEYKNLHIKALKKQGEMIRLIFTKMHIDGAQLPKNLPRPTYSLTVNLVGMVAFLHLLFATLMPFRSVEFQLEVPSIALKEPWIWWGYKLVVNILEVLMTATISFVATQPIKHFEIGNNRFCSVLMWFPCSSFAECCKKEEVMDFEAHSDNYANPHGSRKLGFNASENSRRLQTNSLPTFRTPMTDVEKNMPMRTLPCSGRHTNHASAVSLLSYYRSKRTLSVSTNDGLEELERTLCNQNTLSSDGRNNSLRPASMLYKDKGFIRFRRENDPQQPMEMSDEDDHIHDDADTSLEDGESTKANAGSSFRSLLEGDIVQNTLSPFFQIGYKRRFRKMSRVSIETTDYSADVSSDQLSNVVNLRNGLSTSALDFHTRKYGSTCSSESAANSFDVTFYLTSNSSPEMKTSPTSTTPASLNICSAYRSETEDDKTSSVEGHEVMLRSVSPIVKRASSGRLSLNLNLQAAANSSHSNGHVNVACGTEDITPDSAVYLDLQLSRENTMDSYMSSRLFPSNLDSPTRISPTDSFTKSTDGILPLSPETNSDELSSTIPPSSQSLGELRTSSSYAAIPRIKKNSKGLLYKLRGSTFSLNAAIYGYEPLEPVSNSRSSLGSNTRNRLQRCFSDRQTLSEEQLDTQLQMTPLGEFRNRTTETGSGFLGDSGLLGDCGVVLVDVASQTEETDECTHKTCTLLMKNSMLTDSHPHLSTQLVDIRK